MSKDEKITILEQALRAVEKVVNDIKVKPAQNDNEVESIEIR